MKFLRRNSTLEPKPADPRSLEDTLDQITDRGEPPSGQPKASADRFSRLMSLAALVLSAIAFYYSSIRHVDDLKMFSDGRVYAVVDGKGTISAEIPDVLYFANGGTRPIAITYIDPMITFTCQNGKDSLTIGTPISTSVVSIDAGKIVAAKVTPAKFSSQMDICALKSITAIYTIDAINTDGITQRVTIPWKLMGNLPMVTGLAFGLEGPVQIFHREWF